MRTPFPDVRCAGFGAARAGRLWAAVPEPHSGRHWGAGRPAHGAFVPPAERAHRPRQPVLQHVEGDPHPLLLLRLLHRLVKELHFLVARARAT